MFGNGPSGAEMLLRSMGMGDVIEMAKRFATDGTLDKIVKFVDDMERQNELLERLLDRLGPGAGAPDGITIDHEPASAMPVGNEPD